MWKGKVPSVVCTKKRSLIAFWNMPKQSPFSWFNSTFVLDLFWDNVKERCLYHSILQLKGIKPTAITQVGQAMLVEIWTKIDYK